MESTERESLIARYNDGYRVVVEALEGITDVELDAPSPDGWTARMVVHHLADSEMTSAIRLRKLIAEENPLIAAYDEEAFARNLYYATRPVVNSLEAFRLARVTSAEILDRLSEEEWSRQGTHSESGPYSTETWLEIYAQHAHDHADQIRRARAAAQG